MCLTLNMFKEQQVETPCITVAASNLPDSVIVLVCRSSHRRSVGGRGGELGRL